MKRLRTLVVEDEPIARQALMDLLTDVEWIETIGTAGSGPEAVRLIDDLRPDLVFLDIQLPELTGIEVLRAARHQPAVIVTTAYDAYAVSAFELSALDYLLKPFSGPRLARALERARPLAEGPTPGHALPERLDAALRDTTESPLERFFVRDRNRLVPLHVKDIERLEADDDYVRVVTKGMTYLVHLTLNDFERRLDAKRFLRVHRTHIVNLDFVLHLLPYDGSRVEVEMRDGTKIVASRTRSRELRDNTF
ncbi:MAG: LytTR family DNA-binding domain-containing protein [Gemmatimonadaceae bacterium]